MCERPPMETDRLLPTPVSERKTYSPKKDDIQHRRRRCLIVGAATLALVFSVHSVMPHRPEHPKNNKHHDKYKAKDQLGALQHLTELSLLGAATNPTKANANVVTPSSHHGHRHSHPKGKIDVIDDRQHENLHANDVLRCTSQVMVMRHCDKAKKFKDHHGKTRTTDTVDERGNRHCSTKGEARSKYIATLFVDPNNYHKLGVEEKEIDDGVPPVPFVRSSLAKHSKEAAPQKPQFTTPHKLYALSSERPKDKKPWKGHMNFREVETITPVADKFDLDVDERFGIGEEGELAEDFFDRLSRSVAENVYAMTRASSNNSTTGGASSSSSSAGMPNLCHNGMTVVNWKHSRIPILARALGCGKDEGCPTKYKGHDFDTVWLLTFQYSLSLGGGEEKPDVDAEFLALESLSKSATQGSIRHRKKKKKHSGGDGSWKVTAEQVSEGFDSN